MRYDAWAFLESLYRPDAGTTGPGISAEHAGLPAVTPADLPADWHFVWEERAAIMEYDGGLPRERAEHFALLEVLKQMRAAGC